GGREAGGRRGRGSGGRARRVEQRANIQPLARRRGCPGGRGHNGRAEEARRWGKSCHGVSSRLGCCVAGYGGTRMVAGRLTKPLPAPRRVGLNCLATSIPAAIASPNSVNDAS